MLAVVFGLLLVAVFAVDVTAQGLTDTGTHAPPSTGSFPYSPPGTWLPGQPGFLGLGQTYVDPVFGTNIRRLSNVFPGIGNGLIYNRNGFWNADGTRYAQNPNASGTVNIIDTQTGATVRANVPFSASLDASFDPVNPDIFYYPSGASLRQYSLTTGLSTTVVTFGATLGSLGGSVDFIDRTGRYFLVNVGGNVQVWDKQLNVLYSGSIPASTYNGVNGWAGISPDGNWVIVGANFNHVSYVIDHVAQTLSTTGTIFWNLCGDHADVVSASDGKTYEIVFNCWDIPAVYRVDVSIPAGTVAQQKAANVKLFDLTWIDAGHFSCARGGANQDWCFMSVESEDDTFTSTTSPWRPYEQEIVMAQMVPPFTVRRIAHHRSRDPQESVYTTEARVNSNWDGTKVMWASNYGYNGNQYSDIYAAELASSVPTLTSLAPSSAAAGSAGFVMTVNGSAFVSTSVVQWNGSPRTTTLVSSTQLQATLTAADLATAGSASVQVVTPAPGGGTSSALTFTISSATNPVPTLTSLSPSSATAGGAAFTLTVTGTNFVGGAVVQWNGSARTTTFVSSTQLAAAITAADIAAAGTPSVTVFSPAPGGGTSGALVFTVNNPAPTVTSLSPTSGTVGGVAFTLTVNGTNFVSSSVVQWNGSNRTTTFVNSTRLTAAIGATDIATAGTASVRVVSPAPGGGTSNALTFTINIPVPTLTSISPASATAGATGFTLTATGSSFVNGSVVQWNGSARTTTFVSATQLTATITAADVATAGTVSVTVFSPTPGGGTSSAKTFTINNPVPTLASVSPSSATAGGTAFTLTVTGTNFVASSVVQWNGGARTTTFASSTQLTAAITAADIATAGTASITVFSPTPGGGTTGATTFTINNPAPTVGSLSPSSVTVGAAAFTLTVSGTNFVAGSVVQWNGSARATTFVSSTQVTAAITAADIATAGTTSVTVFSPTPGGGTTGAATFTINNPAPTLTSVSPSSAIAGGAAFTLTATGTSFVAGSVVQWNGSARTTTFVSSTQLTAAITAADIATTGTASVTVFSPTPGGGTSSAVTFTISGAANPVPTLATISPVSAVAGGASFTLTVTGTNFIAASVVQWNGGARATTFVSGTQLTAAITAADIATAGIASVTVSSPAPGGGTSAVVVFIIEPGTPPAAATQVAPSGTLANGTPTYTWNAVPGATRYLLWVDDSSGGRIRTTYTPWQVGCATGTGTCSMTPTVVLEPGAGQWWVVSGNTAGDGPWSAGLTFTVPGTPPPGAATQVAPSGTTSVLPTYVWNAVPTATQYLLWVDDSSGGRIRTTYTAAQAGCASGTGTCSITPPVVLVSGAGQWWVVSANASGSGPWSAGMTFTVPLVPPGQATLLAPTGTLTAAQATPTFTWNAVPGATQYLLWLDDSSGGRLRTWYTATQAGCAGGTGVCSVSPGVLLNPGAGQWWIVTANTAGQGPWSSAMTYTVAGTPPPGAATLIAPAGSITTATPTFTWNAVPGATQYLLWLDDASGGRLRTWYTAAQANCASGTGTCSIAPGLILASGAGQWWIVTANASGDGPWSLGVSFTVP